MGVNFIMKTIIKELLIIFSPEDKLDICINNKIDIMIEDKVDNINKISTRMLVICYNAGYNEKCVGKTYIEYIHGMIFTIQ